MEDLQREKMKNKLLSLIKYYDEHLWGYKVTETNWNYNGLILDYYFDNSVLAIDYLDVGDYFSSFKIEYSETVALAAQFEVLDSGQYFQFIQAILNILKFSKHNEEESREILNKSINYLLRQGFKVINNSTDIIEVYVDDILGKGAYCKVIKYAPSIVKKTLLDNFKSDGKLKKRIQYEYENTKKLSGNPNIITVYSYHEEEDSYLLEEAEMDLFEYLKGQVSLSKEDRLKIILDVLNGIKSAHDNDIIHRDLHLGNILKIGASFVISDFGWSKDISIVRSLKSSASEKNNHMFMDPLAAGDLTKMDKQTDIYSIGKIMEYVYTFNNTEDKRLDFIISKCTARDRGLRYNLVDEILEDLNSIIKEVDEEEIKQKIIENIKKGILNHPELEYIKKLASKDELCNYIVKYKLSGFGKIITQMPELEQKSVLENISRGFANSTGYGGFHNYIIYGEITYYTFLHSSDVGIKRISKSILEDCSSYRWESKRLLDEIDSMNI